MILEYPVEQPSFIEWSPLYCEVAAIIIDTIKANSEGIDIHHVGSSSVEGCGGKGSIDLAVVYDKGQLDYARAVVDELGFQRQKTRNLFPESRPMRTGAIKHKGKRYKIHVHVLVKNSEEFAEMIQFRDSLRENSDRKRVYIELKKQILSDGVCDSVDYSEKKGRFFKKSYD